MELLIKSTAIDGQKHAFAEAIQLLLKPPLDGYFVEDAILWFGSKRLGVCVWG